MIETQTLKVVLIGSGNVAWHIGKAMIDNGIEILQLYSPHHAGELAKEWNVPFTHKLSLLNDKADIYLFAIKDDGYEDIAHQFPFQNKCMIHTSGSVDLDVFQSVTSFRGVLYPFQTFTKGMTLSFKEVPLCMEASDKKTAKLIEKLAPILSNRCYKINTLQRKQLHLAGVFACNFTNAMYCIAKKILEEYDMDFSLLIPLINETTRKVNVLSPEKAQTGPAVRSDTKIMNKHIELISDKNSKQIYSLISKIIQEKYSVTGI